MYVIEMVGNMRMGTLVAYLLQSWRVGIGLEVPNPSESKNIDAVATEPATNSILNMQVCDEHALNDYYFKLDESRVIATYNYWWSIYTPLIIFHSLIKLSALLRLCFSYIGGSWASYSKAAE